MLDCRAVLVVTYVVVPWHFPFGETLFYLLDHGLELNQGLVEASSWVLRFVGLARRLHLLILRTHVEVGATEDPVEIQFASFGLLNVCRWTISVVVHIYRLHQIF